MAVITNAGSYPVVVPQSRAIPGAYIPPYQPVSGVTIKKVYASPDYARDELTLQTLDKVTKSFFLAVYQVSSIKCQGPKLTLLYQNCYTGG